MGIIYVLDHPTHFTNSHRCDQVIYPVKILLKTIVVGVFEGLEHTVCEWKMHWELSEAVTLVRINYSYNFSNGHSVSSRIFVSSGGADTRIKPANFKNTSATATDSYL